MNLDKFRSSTALLLLSAWLFISLLSALEVAIIQLFRPDAIDINIAFLLPAMRFVSGVGAIFLILIPSYTFFSKRAMGIMIAGYTLAGVLFVLVYASLFVFLFQTVNMQPTLSLFLAGVSETLMSDLHHIAAYYFFLLFICSSKDYYDDRTATIVKKEQIEKELAETKLHVLKSQIQPHFLFNTLNNVISIMDEKKRSAQEMLVELSELLRTSLDIDYSKKISLHQELEILSTYLGIEKKRFEHQLNITIDIPNYLKEKEIPPFIIQPLVENSIKHGFKGGLHQIHIHIDAQIEEDALLIHVRNDGAPLENSREGIGLKNLRARLQNIYQDRFDLSLRQEPKWVVNQIKIPLP